MRVFTGCFLLCIAALAQTPNPVIEERAPESIERLPREVRHDLATRHCLVPKYRGRDEKSYVRGRFRLHTSDDYAVVCHVPSRKLQEVLVYSFSGAAWTGEVIEHGSFDASPNVDKCEWTLYVAHPAKIREYARAYAPEELKHLHSLDHDGVEIALCDKASIIRYFRQGHWVRYQGGD